MVTLVAQAIATPDVKPSLNALPRSLQQLITQIQRQPHLNPAVLRDCVQAAQIQPDDLLPWADFEHPVTDGYGRQLVYDGGHFEVMVMSWREGDFSAIHDHGSAQWGVVQCFGDAEHYTYRFEDNVLSTLERCDFVPGEIKLVDHDLIHQMGNPGQERILSLHIYGCHQSTSSITGNARIFDLLEQTIQFTDGGVFFVLPDDKIEARQGGIRGDRAATLRHHSQMRDRLQRMVREMPDNSQWRSQLTKLEVAIQAMH